MQSNCPLKSPAGTHSGKGASGKHLSVVILFGTSLVVDYKYGGVFEKMDVDVSNVNWCIIMHLEGVDKEFCPQQAWQSYVYPNGTH